MTEATVQFVRIWHDRLSHQVIETMSDEDFRSRHHRWADSLAKDDSALAAEIAIHYEKSANTELAIKWARKAAAEAQKLYAHTEAARWFCYVAENHRDTNEKIKALTTAAELLQHGARLADASGVYKKLATMLTGTSKARSRIESSVDL